MRRLLLLLFIGLAGAVPTHAAEPSLGEKIKNIFSTPTPTPSHRRHKQTTKKSSPGPPETPSPSSTKKTTSAAEEEGTPEPTPKKKHKASSTPPPKEDETPPPKRKKKSSPTPSPSETPEATPSEPPSPTPEESASPAEETAAAEDDVSSENKSVVATIPPNELKGYDDNPAEIRKVLETALALTNRDLKYTYGSAEPENGGLDCSGFIYYVLRENGVKDVPRDASGQYVWVRKAGNFRAVLSRDLDSFELNELKPGDLLFWTGTYDVEKDPPVTHTMIYLGTKKEDGKPVMLGASDGRSFEGKRMSGVSVFDFKTSSKQQGTSSGRYPRFVGYGRIPGLGPAKE